MSVNRSSLPNFADFPIRTKLAIGFGTVFFVAAVVALVGGLAVLDVRDSANTAGAEGHALNAAAIGIQYNVAAAQEGVGELVAQSRTGNARLAEIQVGPVIRTHLETAESLVKDAAKLGDRDSAIAPEGRLTDFRSTIESLISALEVRGNSVSGKEGSFWVQTRKVEDTTLARTGGDRVAAAALAVRRAADEWLGRPDDLASERVQATLATLKAEAMVSPAFVGADRDALTGFIDEQGRMFSELVIADGNVRTYLQQLDDQSKAVDAWATEVRKAGAAASAAAHDDIASTTSRALLTLGLITLVGLVLAALLVTVLSRLITGPIGRLAEVSNRMSLGELDVQIDVHGKDEVGQLADSLRRMQASLRAAIERLRARRAA